MKIKATIMIDGPAIILNVPQTLCHPDVTFNGVSLLSLRGIFNAMETPLIVEIGSVQFEKYDEGITDGSLSTQTG